MWAIWIWCEQFEFDVSNLFLMWAICFWCEQFAFDVSNLFLIWAICFLMWAICFWCEQFAFDVSNLFLMWAICFWCEQFVFAVSNLFLLWAICFWCEQFVFDVSNLFLMWAICYCRCTCGPPYIWICDHLERPFLSRDTWNVSLSTTLLLTILWDDFQWCFRFLDESSSYRSNYETNVHSRVLETKHFHWSNRQIRLGKLSRLKNKHARKNFVFPYISYRSTGEKLLKYQ